MFSFFFKFLLLCKHLCCWVSGQRRGLCESATTKQQQQLRKCDLIKLLTHIMLLGPGRLTRSSETQGRLKYRRS